MQTSSLASNAGCKPAIKICSVDASESEENSRPGLCRSSKISSSRPSSGKSDGPDIAPEPADNQESEPEANQEGFAATLLKFHLAHLNSPGDEDDFPALLVVEYQDDDGASALPASWRPLVYR